MSRRSFLSLDTNIAIFIITPLQRTFFLFFLLLPQISCPPQACQFFSIFGIGHALLFIKHVFRKILSITALYPHDNEHTKSLAADSRIVLRQAISQSKPNNFPFGAEIFHAPRPQNFSIGNPRATFPPFKADIRTTLTTVS